MVTKENLKIGKCDYVQVPIQYSIVSLRARANLVPLFRPTCNILVKLSVLEQKHEDYDPIIAFTCALKAPESRGQYPGRFKPFLAFLKLEGSLSEKAPQTRFCRQTSQFS